MDILKPISFIFLFSIFSCKKNCNEYIDNSIQIYDWKYNWKPKKIGVKKYKKGSFFKEELSAMYEKSSCIIIDDIDLDGSKQLIININDNSFFPFEISSKYDYQIVLEDSIIYEISDMESTLFIDEKHHTMGGAQESCVLGQIKVNGKLIKKPMILRIPYSLGKKIVN